MDEIRQCTEALKKAVRESDDYKGFAKAKAALEANPELREKVMTFRRRNYEIQNCGQVEDIFAAQEELNNQYKDMRNQNMVNRYLLAEVCLCRMVQDICRTVVDAIDFDLDFLG